MCDHTLHTGSAGDTHMRTHTHTHTHLHKSVHAYTTLYAETEAQDAVLWRKDGTQGNASEIPS